jgi:hypothetical protein
MSYLLGFLLSLTLTAPQLVVAVETGVGDFGGVVTDHFATWDRDHDGVLSTNELNILVADLQVTNRAAAAVAALKRASRSRTLKLPPLSLTNILSLATNKPSADKPDFTRMFREGLSRLPKSSSRQLFASALPKLETIHQGKLGNCFCLAPLGAMVHRDPKRVAAMFVEQADGSYLVKLGKEAIRVTPPTDAEIAMTSSNEGDGIWINLYEKAVAKVRNDARPPEQRAGSEIDALARGGSAGTVLALITGNEIERFSFKFAKDPTVTDAERLSKLSDLRQKLATAAERKRLMTCGTLKTTTPGVNPNHAYAVLDYDAKADLVRLWNPHGGSFKPKGESGLQNGYAATDGIFQVPLPHFVQQFSGMAFQVTEVATSTKEQEKKPGV